MDEETECPPHVTADESATDWEAAPEPADEPGTSGLIAWWRKYADKLDEKSQEPEVLADKPRWSRIRGRVTTLRLCAGALDRTLRDEPDLITRLRDLAASWAEPVNEATATHDELVEQTVCQARARELLAEIGDPR